MYLLFVKYRSSDCARTMEKSKVDVDLCILSEPSVISNDIPSFVVRFNPLIVLTRSDQRCINAAILQSIYIIEFCFLISCL